MSSHTDLYTLMLRKIAISAWIVIACIGWLVAAVGGLHVLERIDPDLFRKVLKAVPLSVLFVGMFIAGPLMVMGLAGYLALRGHLPGTRGGGRVPPPAFPVVPLSEPEI